MKKEEKGKIGSFFNNVICALAVFALTYFTSASITRHEKRLKRIEQHLQLPTEETWQDIDGMPRQKPRSTALKGNPA